MEMTAIMHAVGPKEVSKENARNPFLGFTARMPYFCPELIPKILRSKRIIDIVFPIQGCKKKKKKEAAHLL